MLRTRGITLLETLVYVVIVAMILVLIVQALFSMSTAYVETQLSRALAGAATQALERISRTARDAESIDTASSTFGVNPGKLVLDTSETTTSVYTSFYIGGAGELRIGTESGNSPLTPEGVEVTSLVFRQVLASSTEGVKIEMELRASQGNQSVEIPFYNTLLLRGSYE